MYKNVPRKYETTFFIQSREQLLDDSGDETQSLRFFTGNLNYNVREEIEVERKLETGRIVTEKKYNYSKLAVDSFIETFRHDF